MAGKFKFDWQGVRDTIKQDDAKKKSFEKDTRFFEPTKDAEGNAFVILRFIPDQNGTPYVKYYSHSFNYMKNGAKKWWIRNCINTFGYDRECPICAKNQELFNSAFQSDKDLAGQRKRKLNYIANVMVIQDKANPDREGKVFLFRFGQKIFDKIKKHMFPSEENRQDPEFLEFIPFDLYEGANFKLSVKKQGDFPNYDESEFFKSLSAVYNGDDDKIDKLMAMTHDLTEFVAEDKFPKNSEIITALGHELNMVAEDSQQSSGDQGGDKEKDKGKDDVPFDFEKDSSAEPAAEPTPEPKKEEKKEEPKKEEKKAGKVSVADEPAAEPAEAAASGVDEDLEFFKNLK